MKQVILTLAAGQQASANVCASDAVIAAEATICEGAVSYFDAVGVQGLAEEVKSLAETLETPGCDNTCSLGATNSVDFGKRGNGKAWATVRMAGAE